mmetsp:Transcript_28909/g.38539  ORF Transcript_28909/g.38539 Transcript_28909/m.38539 type:complete len:179 (+) Transcript_28909:1228-1764(+)
MSPKDYRFNLPGYKARSIADESRALFQSQEPLHDPNALEIYAAIDEDELPAPREPQKLTLDDVQYLWDEHGMSPDQIIDVPGYEDFEIVDGPLYDQKDYYDEEEYDQEVKHVGHFEEQKEPRGPQSKDDIEVVLERNDNVYPRVKMTTNLPLAARNISDLDSIIGYNEPRYIDNQVAP